MTGPLTLSPIPKLQFFLPGTTQPAIGAQIFTYAAGTMTKQATYSDKNGTPNTNPIILDANGECVCYVDSTLEYDFWFSPSTDNDPPTNPYWTVFDVGYGNMIDGLAPINSPAFTGTPTAPTPTTGDNSTNIATTQFVQETVTAAFVNPTATTPSAGDYSTKVATTAYVGNEINRAWQMLAMTNSGTWTIPANVKWAKFRLWGGGGGGGGGVSGASPGSGGGAGGYTEGTISLGSNTTLAIVIGTGGAGGSPGNAGSAGTASTIAALGITANAGTGGAGNGGTPGSGGSASGLAFNVTGEGGGVTPNATVGMPGGGSVAFGSYPFGFGSGGVGAGGGSGGSSASGNVGGSGLCIIEYLEP